MQIIDAATVGARLAAEPLIAALERMFRDGCTAPVRHHHTVPVPGGPDAVLLLMPAWRAGAYLGIKLVNVFPGNSSRHLPAVSAAYVLMDGSTGEVRALIDGNELTARRTAATSALAARHLARPDARTLLVVGTGRIARELAVVHAAVRPNLERILVWGRTAEHAAALARGLEARGLPARAVAELAPAVAEADLISTATISTVPLIDGAWVRPGAHVDLVGGYTPAMREANDALMARARVFVDTRAGALSEAGDVTQPLANGTLAADSVGELAELCRGTRGGRRSDDEITVFKSVGAALEDLAAAILVYESG
jgi:ornithine cyclodeaminase